MKRRVTVILISLVSILAVLSVYFGFYGRENRNINIRSSAASGSATLTSQVEWEFGTLDNIDSTTTPGSMGIDDVTSSDVDLVSLASGDPSLVSASADEADKLKPVDGVVDPLSSWPASAWEVHSSGGAEEHYWWQIDLESIGQITELTMFADSLSADFKFQTSTDGISFTDRSDYFDEGDGQNPPAWYSTTFSANVRYIRIEIKVYPPGLDPDPYVRVSEVRASTNAQATHTSASTQLDAGDHDTVEWTTFVPSDSIPANTSIEYRFRTSDDHATWGDWTASTPSAASIDISTLLGGTDNAKRYLQVESTLANTDGVSTPTISAYTANYDYTDAPAETCSDGIQNQDETGIDCGGTICDACVPDPTCSDGIQNGDETGVDCGGSICDACDEPETCNNNGIQDNGESGVDCGGGGCDDCPPPEPTDICDTFSHLVISPSSLSIGTNRSATITYYGVDDSGNVMSGLSEFLVVSAGTLVGNRYTAPSQAGIYSMAASSVCGNASGSINVYVYTPPPEPPEPPPTPEPPPPPCAGDDCYCEDNDSGEEICWCVGPDCTCSDPDGCLPCVGEDCVCDPDTMVCHCEGDECVCNDPERCEEEPEPKKPLPICIGPYCSDIDPKVIEVAGSVSTAALGIAALVASLLLLMQGLANVLTMIRPSQIWAYLLKGRDKKRAKGLVYDVSSGIGIPLAKVLLFRSRDQKLIRVATTGSDGKFALETPPGEEYFIQVKKEGYELRPLSIYERNIIKYENGYSGEKFTPQEADSLFDRTVPLSATAESVKFAKGILSLEKLNKILRFFNIPLVILGLVMSAIATLETSSPYNLTILSIYVLIIFYSLTKILFVGGKSVGFVTKNMTNEPIDLAIIRAISDKTGKLVKTVVSNNNGHYTLAVNRGKYKILAAKAGLMQAEEISEDIRSNFRPVKTRIHMNAVVNTMRVPETDQKNSIVAQNTGSRAFEDSDSIIEDYKTKFGQLGP